MSTLATPTLDAATLAQRSGAASIGASTRISPQARKLRQQVLDAAISRSRVNNPNLAQRQVERFSIAELNQADAEQISERFARSRFDERSPVVKAIDLIDLPRNAVLNVLAPRLAAERAKTGERAAFGLPRVSVADVLDELGVENRAVRAIGGFIGDVAIDPLTYVGPPGWGLRLTAAAGKGATATRSVLQINAAGKRAIFKGMQQTARGGVAKDETVRSLIKAAGFTPEIVSGMVAQGVKRRDLMVQMRRSILGDPFGNGFIRATETALRPLGGDIARADGMIARTFFNPAAALSADAAIDPVRASREFVQRFGKTSSQVAHVPFTGMGLNVPAFTAAGRSARVAALVAGQKPPELAESNAAIKSVQDFLTESDRLSRELQKINEARAATVADADARAAEARTGGRIDEAVAEELARDQQVEQLSLARDALKERLRDMTADFTVLSGQSDTVPFSINQLLAYSEKKAALTTRINAIQKSLDIDSRALKRHQAFRTAQTARIERSLRVLARLNEPVMGDVPLAGMRSILFTDARGNVLVNSDLDALSRASQRIEPLLDQLDAIRVEMRALRARQTPFSATQGELFEDAERTATAKTAAADRLDELDAEAAQLRDRIADEAQTLRTGDLQPVEDVTQTISQAMELHANRMQAEMLNMTDEELVRFSDDVEDNRQALAAAWIANEAAGGSVANFLNELPADQRAMIGLAKLALGTNDDLQGASALLPITHAYQRYTGRENDFAVKVLLGVDRRAGSVFGRGRDGLAHRYVRALERGHDQDARRAYAQAANELHTALSRARKRHEIPPARMTEVYTLTLAFLYKASHDHVQRATLNSIAKARGVRPDQVRALPDLTPDELRLLDGADSDARFFTQPMAEGDGTGENFFTYLQEAQDSGLLSKSQHPGLHDDLNAIATEIAARLRDMGDDEVYDDILRGFVESYVPTIPNPRGAKAFRTTQAERLRRGGGDAMHAEEAFQKTRSTRQYRFQSEVTGRLERFFEFERALVEDMSDDLLETMALTEPDKAQRIAELRAIINEYDNLANPPPPRETDVFELNALAKRGRFKPISGTTEPLWETDIRNVYATRSMAHERARARADALRHFTEVPRFAVKAQTLTDAANTPGASVRLAGGAKATVVNRVGSTTGRDMAAVKVGDDIYRRVDQSVMQGDNPFAQFFGDTTEWLYPEIVAEKIERAASILNSEKDTNELLRIADRLTALWKTTTLLHPSWLGTEIIGNTMLMMMGGVNPASIARHAGPLMKAVLRATNPEANKQTLFTGGAVAGRHGDEVMRLMLDSQVTDVSQGVETLLQMGASDFLKMPSQAGRRVLNMPTNLRDWFASTSTDPLKARSPLEQGYVRRLIGGWFRIDAAINDYMRGLFFLSKLDDGMDPLQAAGEVRRHMFDFTDLTQTETGLRRLLPFYTWMKSNMAYQARMLFERPAYAANTPRLKEAIEDAINGEQTVPEWARPQWMRDQMALQVGKDPSTRQAILTRSAVPTGDAFEILSGIFGPQGRMDFLQFFVGSTNPLLKGVFEIAAGREVFTKREIGATAEEGDISLKDYLLGQIRPVREAGFGLLDRESPLGRAGREGAGALAARTLAGGRVQSFEEERIAGQRLSEFEIRVTRLRRAIRRAEREGNAEQSANGRVQLLALYRRMIEAGFGGEVPRWAHDQIAQFGAQAVNAQ